MRFITSRDPEVCADAPTSGYLLATLRVGDCLCGKMIGSDRKMIPHPEGM
jgi:hypothetical protein